MRKFDLKLLLSFFLFCTQLNFAQTFTESFDNITTLAANGWSLQNNSTPVGSLSWFQGTATTATPTPGPFNAYNGAANAYIAANFNSTGSTGTISNWLITPNRVLRNGDVFTFYTRKPTIGGGQTDYADRLEVRMSTNGASTNVGTGAAAVGDFTTLLLSINPTLVANVYPQVWTKYTITVSGLPSPTSGRIAFRYFVTGAGSLGTNSDYIGIDQVDYTPYVCPAFTMTSSGALPGAQAGTAYSTLISQTGALGAPNFAVTAGALPPGLSLSASGTISGTPTATGTFNFTVTVSDASGCSGSASYSVTVLCRSNVAALSDFPVLCTNSGLYTLSEGFPAGGTYSGTGVSGGQFDPAAGTQVITYDYTDPYGCSYSVSKTVTVNAASVITTQPTANTVCVGENVSFSAAAGNATGYQWQVNQGSGFTDITNGGIYSGATTATLKINGVTSGLNGYAYRMTATGLCTPAVSNTAVLTVNAVTAITTQPTASTVCAGANATFSAVAGNATGYQWQVNQGSGFTDITNGGIYSGATTAALSINGVTAGLSGYVYRVTATGLCTPAVSNTAVLTVSSTSAPTGEAIQSFNAGDTLSVLTVTGSNIKWYATATDAANHVNELPVNTVIVNNTVYYATQSIAGCESSVSLAVKAYNESLGTNQEAGSQKIQVYPNPVKETLYFSGNQRIDKIIMISADGRKSAEKTLNGERKADVHSLPAGVYILKIFTDKGIQTVKIIKN
ncbi:MAG: choice-of-anchor J domain-containing protein [Weeksellaceae bacterium]|nr:choice-of-anchor J domain-containing protein [Bacteroidota bacterium]MCG2780297.1 choice-of-anchor J domain-containing protein [Weeksellaceae bacterium]